MLGELSKTVGFCCYRHAVQPEPSRVVQPGAAKPEPAGMFDGCDVLLVIIISLCLW